jgi:hypothetical protein
VWFPKKLEKTWEHTKHGKKPRRDYDKWNFLNIKKSSKIVPESEHKVIFNPLFYPSTIPTGSFDIFSVEPG